ncbi:MAG: type ISP restriction/modification enzyme [Planctomycetota bacterium]
MAHSVLIKPTHKAITEYYRTLADTTAQGAANEMAIRRAFRELLATTAKLHGWTIIEEESHAADVVKGGGKVQPDATFRDKNTLPRGYWEAKDTADDLDAEIRKKTKKGYSLVNTIFEDTRTAVLYQNAQEALRIDLTDPQAVSDLLNGFYAHTEPDFDRWEKAVEDFKDRVPELAKGLVTIVETAHKKNARFKQAFADFFALCQTALNPNIAEKAVDEMLIQHILTERLFRTIFNRADFTQRNVIAAEVEKVITALASQSFSREEYLKGLDRFYLAIENAARHLEWAEKQHFLNVIYERFFQGYSVKTADTMGIVYTPQPIVDFMCASVAEVLKNEFNKELGDPDVFILDPCTGTGNFIVNLLRRIPPKKLTAAYAHNLFANEIMLLPYYIAALNVEHAYYELSGTYEAFEGLCFVDSLDIAEHPQNGFDFFTEKNTERVERQKKTQITVVIGNPPYNVGQMIHNEQNRNRPYSVIDARVSTTYAAASSATSVSKLNDPYVKFIRWATDRLGTRDGIVCFVTNNSLLEQVAFDGMRKHLLQDFTAIYHLDLKGNVRKNPKLSGTQYNVFGIQVGVGITVLVRRQTKPWSVARGRPAAGTAFVRYADIAADVRRAEKLTWVQKQQSVTGVRWKKLHPDEKHSWLVPENGSEYDSFISIGNKDSRSSKKNNVETVFKDYSLGVATHRDQVVYDFSYSSLVSRLKEFIEDYNAEIDRWKRAGSGLNVDEFVSYTKIAWDRDLKKDLTRYRYVKFVKDKVRCGLYRPFCKQQYYLDRVLNGEIYSILKILPTLASKNVMICVPGLSGRANWTAIVTDCIPNLSLTSLDSFQCFAFYIYDDDGSNRRENITDWALEQFRSHYKGKRISKWDIFYYVYGLLHHPGYREKFSNNLKRELPRIPFAPDCGAFTKAGKKLADLHLNYESAKEFPLKEKNTPGIPRSPRVESKMKLTKDKTALMVNESLTLTGIPPATFDYKLGNRSALDWVIDQYQVYTDKRTGITSDPNAWGEEHDNPEYIIELLARVITVSLETLKIVKGLPKEYAN